MNRIPDWIQIFVKVDTGYRIGYEISLILVDIVSGTGYMYPDIPGSKGEIGGIIGFLAAIYAFVEVFCC